MESTWHAAEFDYSVSCCVADGGERKILMI